MEAFHSNLAYASTGSNLNTTNSPININDELFQKKLIDTISSPTGIEQILSRSNELLTDIKKTSRNQNIQAIENKLSKLVRIKNILENCNHPDLSDKEVFQNKKNQLMSGLATQFIDTASTQLLHAPCAKLQNSSLPTIEQFDKIYREQLSSQIFERAISDNVINIAKEYLNYFKQFDSNIKDTNKLIDKAYSYACYKNICDRQKGLSKRVRTALVQLSNSEEFKKTKSENLEESTSKLNAKLKVSETWLQKVKIKSQKNSFFSDSPQVSDETKKQIEAVKRKIVAELVESRSKLLFTPTLLAEKFKLPTLSEQNLDDDWVNQGDHFSFKGFEKLSVKDVENAKKEYFDTLFILSKKIESIQASEEARQHSNRNKSANADLRFRDIGEIAYTSPFSVGKIIVDYPLEGYNLCQVIIDASLKAEEVTKTQNRFRKAAIAASFAILGASAGTLGHGFLLTGSIARTLSLESATGQILRHLTLAGAGTSLSLSAIELQAFNQKSYDARIKEAAFITQNAQIEELSQIEKDYEELKNIEYDFYKNLALSGLSVLALPSLKFMSQSFLTVLNKAKSSERLKFMKSLTDPQVNLRLAHLLKESTPQMLEKFNRFMLHLSSTSENARLKTLEFLKNSKVTPEKWRKVYSETLEAATKCKI